MLWVLGILNLISGSSLIGISIRGRKKGIADYNMKEGIVCGVGNILVGLTSCYVAWKGWN